MKKNNEECKWTVKVGRDNSTLYYETDCGSELEARQTGINRCPFCDRNVLLTSKNL